MTDEDEVRRDLKAALRLLRIYYDAAEDVYGEDFTYRGRQDKAVEAEVEALFARHKDDR